MPPPPPPLKVLILSILRVLLRYSIDSFEVLVAAILDRFLAASLK